jgi:hypothetical protein
MDIARGHVEELDDIGGCGKWKEGDEELPTWVSEPCVKAIVLGLLRLLADGQAESTSKVCPIPHCIVPPLTRFAGHQRGDERYPWFRSELEQDMGYSILYA